MSLKDDERKVLHAVRLCANGEHGTYVERDVKCLADVGRLLAENEPLCLLCEWDKQEERARERFRQEQEIQQQALQRQAGALESLSALGRKLFGAQ